MHTKVVKRLGEWLEIFEWQNIKLKIWKLKLLMS
jgi:hypothetical protein